MKLNVPAVLTSVQPNDLIKIEGYMSLGDRLNKSFQMLNDEK